ncbi:uncharacterized protein si:ch211-139g16.8 [Siniperca chuatsi]|uniref:uncharacterized protein si:ch211-139g16.8 n=1 Tax=Siniperca chuatsi TaxID=119488 RepID=UPI001CE0D635|nr:uncharacterized protein si:ch211-139g16.8 [Siniperca chuatsi]
MQGIMRSFTSRQATDMDRLFVWFSLLLTYLPVIESCISQHDEVIWQKTGQNAVLHCTLSSQCLAEDVRYEWFSFKENFHIRLNLLDNPLKYSLNGASLHISSVHDNDSGIYYCAASHGGHASGTEHVGSGTTLVVRDQDKIVVRNTVLWLSFVLLAIYSLVVTFILKKYGCNMSISKRMRKTGKLSEQNNPTKKMQFHEVLQEMYNRRNLERGKQTVSRNHSQTEAASTEVNSPTDDIYQNV